MSAEKIFCGGSFAFVFVFWVVFLCWGLFWVGFRAGFSALSMLLRVTFNVGKRDVCACCWLCGKSNFKRRRR